MSAVAIGIGEDGIIAACDGAYYTYETGNVAGYVSKLILMPEYSAFIAGTGMGAFDVALRWEINQVVNNFDDMVRVFERFSRQVHRHLCSKFDIAHDHPSAEVSCIIGGWSNKRQAFEAYRLVSYTKESIDTDGVVRRLEPFNAERLSGIWCSAASDHAEEFGIASPPADMETAEILARMICACRADSGYIEDKDNDPGRHYNVGGFLQMAIIQRDHVQSWISHRWPEDEIGKPIDGSKGLRVAPWQMGELA